MRVIRHDLDGSDYLQRRTHYIGGLEFVYEDNDAEFSLIRRYIEDVAIEKVYQDGLSQLRFQHRDHLGSIVALSNAMGDVIARMGFDSWGNRRDIQAPEPAWFQWTEPPGVWSDAMLSETPRGYTGHEHLDDHGIIHMNGRIYDPQLARFLQADPFVEDTGTLNRYTYVHNNPLLYTDPSGYLSLGDVVRIGIAVGIGIATSGILNCAAALTALGGAGSIGAYAVAAGGGALAGFVMTGSVEGAMWGAFSGAAFYGIGQWFPGSAGSGNGFWGSSYTGPELARASVAHGLGGGVISRLQGGRFGHGFISAGMSKAFSPAISHIGGNEFAEGAMAAILGETTSKNSGGKFANGAVTAAMAYAFTHLATENGSSDPSEYFEHNTEFEKDGYYWTESSPMPLETQEALQALLDSPMGPEIRSLVAQSGKISLVESAYPVAAFRYSEVSGNIYYSLNVDAYVATRQSPFPGTGISSANLGSLLSHEVGHRLVMRPSGMSHFTE